jgi:hypothetical protein
VTVPLDVDGVVQEVLKLDLKAALLFLHEFLLLRWLTRTAMRTLTSAIGLLLLLLHLRGDGSEWQQLYTHTHTHTHTRHAHFNNFNLVPKLMTNNYIRSLLIKYLQRTIIQLTILAVVALIEDFSTQLLWFARYVIVRDVAVGFLRRRPSNGQFSGSSGEDLDVTWHGWCCSYAVSCQLFITLFYFISCLLVLVNSTVLFCLNQLI